MKNKQNKVFIKLAGLALPYKWVYLALFSIGIILIAADLAFAQNSRVLFDLAPQIPKNMVVRITVVFSIIIILQLGLNFIMNWLNSYLNESVVYAMRRNILDKIQHLPIKYFDTNHSSKVMNIFFNQLEATKNFIVFDVQDIIKLPVTFIMIGAYLFTVHYLLGITAFIASILQLVSNATFKKRLADSLEKQVKVTEEVFFTMGETMQGIREVKINQLEEIMDEKMKDSQQKGVLYNVSLTKYRTIRNIIKELPMKIGYVFGISAGMMLMINQKIGPGDLVAFITLLGKMSEPFNGIVRIYSNFQETMTKAKDLFRVMDEPEEIMTEGDEVSRKIETIEFDNVTFAYNDEAGDILKNVSFKIKGGSTVAFVGPSGAGKSTLIKLLYRFYNPQDGMIRINGRNLNEYSIKSIRSSMAVVSQDIFVFDGTIYDNIVLGRRDIKDEDLENALRVSQAHEFISKLPEGLNTKVGERGIRLSQGQKQRIAIARAIIKESKILILDEPTASLDVDTEASFQIAMERHDKEQTRFIIAHRLTTIKNADYIIFIDNGMIAEMGTQQELILLNGRYKNYREKSLV